jgi:DNA-binding NarL/FixJ family response regulator
MISGKERVVSSLSEKRGAWRGVDASGVSLDSAGVRRASGDLKLRHRQILHLICRGLRNSEIAAQLGLTESTIKGYVRQLFLVFDVTNRTELVGRFVADAADAEVPRL